MVCAPLKYLHLPKEILRQFLSRKFVDFHQRFSDYKSLGHLQQKNLEIHNIATSSVSVHSLHFMVCAPLIDSMRFKVGIPFNAPRTP